MPDDAAFLRELSRVVFRPFGPYEKWIPEWAGYPGVLTYVSEEDGRRLGFAMLTFYRDEPPAYVGDLLAIAVEPRDQGSGIGGSLLAHARTTARRLGAITLVLSVADSNLGAQRLFARHGFRFVDGDHGAYEGGQRTLKMRLSIGEARVATFRATSG